MKYFPTAATTLLTAFLLGVAAWFTVPVMTAVVCVICVVVAIGWPQLMGVTARKSLSSVILITGILAAVGAALVPVVDVVFFWSSVSLAFGVMAIFIIQVIRGEGRPHRVESTLGAIAGVVITTTAAGWVAALRYPAELVGTGSNAASPWLGVRGFFPYEQWGVIAVTQPGVEPSVVVLAASVFLAAGVAASLPWREAVVIPLMLLSASVVAALTMTLWAQLTWLFVGVLVFAATALTASFRRFLIQQGSPKKRISQLAVGAAPVAVMGTLVFFTERLLLG